MRKIQVFILRLLVDSELPSLLRGTLQPVPEGKPAAFQGEEALLAALRVEEEQGETAAGENQGAEIIGTE